MKYLVRQKEFAKINLDIKNKKILELIAINARTPHTIIAKKVGLSRDAVSYRINQLQRNGLIQGYRTVINTELLGYNSYHLLLQVNQSSKDSEKILLDKFTNYPFVRAVIKYTGKYDYQIALIAKTITEFDKLLNQIITDCSGHLQEYEILITTKTFAAESLPRSLVKQDKKIVQKKYHESEQKIDDVDKKILKILSEDANIPLFKIGEMINLSADTVNYRMKKLIECGIMQKFIPVINFAAISYNVYAVALLIQAFTEKKEYILGEFINQDENILWAVKTLGKYNVLMYICTPGLEGFHNTLINLRNQFGEEIKDYEILIAYEEYKYTYYPECINDN